MEDLLETCGRRAKTLLLLYLFVMKAAADCPAPPDRENIILSNKALLQNTFPDGLDVTLECAQGFVIANGSGVITCIDNKWTQPDLVCKKMDCGLPKPQPHMDFVIKHGTLFGASLEVVCEQGYEVHGLKYRKCYNTGWNGKSSCELITCLPPKPVTNGRNSWVSADEPYYGQTIQYVCDEGYTLVGNDSIMCSDEGEYDLQPPTCQSVTTEDKIATKITPTSPPPASGVTTEDKITTKITPTSPPPASEVTTSTDSSATATTRRDKTVTIAATPAVSPSTRGGSRKGDILTAEGKAPTTSVTSATPSWFQDGEAVETNKDVGYVPVIVSVICITLAACLGALFLHKFLLKRKGSYDTREDLKPELLQFQNL